jgi:isoleucyl-tRNA synthetase
LEIDGQAIALTREEVEIRIRPKEGWTSANDRGVVVVLSTELTDELVAEGLARDLVRVIQDRRKELGCEFTDRIEVGIVTESKRLRQAVESFRDYIAQETLATQLAPQAVGGADPAAAKVGDEEAAIYLRVVP